MAHNSRSGPVTIAGTCTHYQGAEVSILVPTLETVVVSATIGVGIDHTQGFNDEARIVVAASAADCALNNYTALVSVPLSLPTNIPALRPFPVAAGGHTPYVNGITVSRSDPGDRFDSTSFVAVFYSS